MASFTILCQDYRAPTSPKCINPYPKNPNLTQHNSSLSHPKRDRACSLPGIAVSPYIVNSSETIIVNYWNETKLRLIAVLPSSSPPSERSYTNASANRRLLYTNEQKSIDLNSGVGVPNITKFIHNMEQFIALLTPVGFLIFYFMSER